MAQPEQFQAPADLASGQMAALTPGTPADRIVRVVGRQFRRLRLWLSPSGYRPERHYMRGGRQPQG
jgi:hypothetical protein